MEAKYAYATSVDATDILSKSLLERKPLNLPEHKKQVAKARIKNQTTHAGLWKMFYKIYITNYHPNHKQLIERAKIGGKWLQAIPNALNGTILSSEEFFDNLLLRYNYTPKYLPETCDGCNKNSMSTTHSIAKMAD